MALSCEMSTMIGGENLHLRLLVAEALCAPLPPFVLVRARTLALRACGVTIGHGSAFWGMPRLVGPGDIGRRLRVGSICGFNIGCLFDLAAPITIADHVSVGHDVRFLTSQGPEGALLPPAPITLGEGAWLGARSIILGGVTVGPGAVVAAGVTVANDIPAHTLVTGAQNISLAKWR